MDWCRTNPRFQEEALQENLRLADRVAEIDQAVSPAAVHGERYDDSGMTLLNN